MFSYNIPDGPALLYSTLLIALVVSGWSFYRKRALIKFVPIPVRKELGQLFPLGDSLSFKDGASWIWGHEKIIFDKSTGTAYTDWFTILGTSAIRIKGALLVRVQFLL